MTDSPEPKKDMVRIAIPAARQGAGVATAGSRETVRIHLPTRPPANPSIAPVPTSSMAAANVIPASAPTPKKETTRIGMSPEPPAVQKKTGPLMDISPVAAQRSSTSPVEIPMFLCWGLLGISASILILQIWNYLA